MTLPQHSSNSFSWGTPPEIIEAARATMGGIDLDPASSKHSNEIVKAEKYYHVPDSGLINQNGFTCEWHGRVFLNPPGGRCFPNGLPISMGPELDALAMVGRDNLTEKKSQSAQKAWWFKLAKEWKTGRVQEAVFLGYSIEILQTTQVDTPEFENQPLPVPLDFPLCFPARRLQFLDATNTPVTGNTHASVIVYLPSMKLEIEESYPRAVRRFKKKFRDIGRCIG